MEIKSQKKKIIVVVLKVVQMFRIHALYVHNILRLIRTYLFI